MRSAILAVTLWLALAIDAPMVPAARAVDTSDALDLSLARERIKAKDFKGALEELMPMLQSIQHADVHNLIGFSLRKTGDYGQAYAYYRKALELDPEHKGALEYLGELYVETGQLDKAREHVVILKRLCPAGCEELTDLEAAIAGSARDNKW
jgi:tetratricopeptide (TPR) repeat protein